MDSAISPAPSPRRRIAPAGSRHRLDAAGFLLAVAVLVALAVAGSGGLASVAGDCVVAAGGDPLAAPLLTSDSVLRAIPLSAPTAYRAGDGRVRFGHLLALSQVRPARLANGTVGAAAALAALVLLRLLSRRGQRVRAPPAPPIWTSGALLRRGSHPLA